MLKRIIISLAAVMFLFGAGTSFAASLNAASLMSGETTKAEVISMFGEPVEIDKTVYGDEKLIFVEDSVRLDVIFKNGVIWSITQSTDF